FAPRRGGSLLIDAKGEPQPKPGEGSQGRKDCRDIRLWPLGKGQSFPTRIKVKKALKQVYKGVTAICFIHDGKSGEFGIAKGI
ncbi:hypothetical protein Tco_0171124, partial [Tanacetum coccineum]